MVKLSMGLHTTMTVTMTMAMTGVSCFLMLLLLQVAHTNAQRPSYAGSRPTGGLNQKDKYHTTTARPVDGIANRFGEPNDSANSIPYGAVQRPPIGWPVVVPQPQYVPLNVNQAGTPQFSLDNRISGNDIGGGNVPAGSVNGIGPFGGQPGFSNVPPQFQPQPQPALPLPAVTGALPLDAHGDQGLIDYLNTVPVDQRPFWFLNYQAIEAQRNSTNPAFTGAIGSRGSFFG